MSGAQRDLIRQVPRITESFQQGNTTIALPQLSGTLSGYTEAVTTVPLLFLIVGVFSILFMQLLLCMRCCLPALKCATVQARDNQNLAEFRTMVARKRRTLVGLDWLFATLSLVSAALVFFASSFYTTAKDVIQAVVRYLVKLSADLLAINSQIQSDSAAVSAHFAALQSNASNACGQYTLSFSSNAANVSAQADSVHSMAASLSNAFKSVDGYIDSYADVYQNYLVYGYFGVSVLVVFMFFVGVACQSKRLLFAHIFVTEIYMLVLTLLVTFIFIVLMVLSDLCVDPYASIVSLLPQNGTVHDVANYYTYCNSSASSPFNGSISQIQSALSNLAGNLSAATSSGACLNDVTLLASELLVLDMQTQVGGFVSDLECTGLSRQYHRLVSDGLCDSLFEALFVTCWTFFGTSLCLFGLVCAVSVTYQFFGTLWRMHGSAGGHRGAVADAEEPEEELDFLKADNIRLKH